MQPTLTRQRIIMAADHGDAQHVQFTETLDEPGFARSVTLHRHDWDGPGEPEDITVTVEPGDRLNSEDTL